MKTTGTPCRECVHRPKQTWEQPCCWCISDEDIVLAHINPEHPVDFTRFEPNEYVYTTNALVPEPVKEEA